MVRIVWTAIEITPVFNIYGVLSVAHGSHSTDLAKNCFPCWMLNQQSYLFDTRTRNPENEGKKNFYKWMNEEYSSDEPSVSSLTSHIPISVWIILNIFTRSGIFFFFLLWENGSQVWNVGIRFFVDSKKFPFHNCNAILIYVDECLHGLWMLWNSFSSSFFLGRNGRWNVCE